MKNKINTETIIIYNSNNNTIDKNLNTNDALFINNVEITTQASESYFLTKNSSFYLFNQKLLEYYNQLRSTHLFTYSVQINSLSSIFNRIASFYLFLVPLYFIIFINILPIEYFLLTSKLIINLFFIFILTCFHLCIYMIIYHIRRTFVEANLEKFLDSIDHMKKVLLNIFTFSLSISILITFFLVVLL